MARSAPGGLMSAPTFPARPQWREFLPPKSGPEFFRSRGIRARVVLKLKSSQPHSDGVIKASAWAQLSCGNSKLHGTERSLRPNVSAHHPHMDPCRATVARILATQKRPRIFPELGDSRPKRGEFEKHAATQRQSDKNTRVGIITLRNCMAQNDPSGLLSAATIPTWTPSGPQWREVSPRGGPESSRCRGICA